MRSDRHRHCLCLPSWRLVGMFMFCWWGFRASVLSASHLCKVSPRVAFQCSQSGHTNSVILSIKYSSVQNLLRIVFRHCKVPFPITIRFLYPSEMLLSFLHRLQPASRSCYLHRPPELPEHCPFCVLNQEVMGINVILVIHTHTLLLCPISSQTKVFSYSKSTASFFSLRRKALLLLFPREELQRKRISPRQKTFLKCFCRLRSLASLYKYRDKRGSSLCVASL